jgi:phenylpyruvate tautomerase PptA (4-oxalocrotonate tautomerase family)
MPCLEITMPAADMSVKQELASALTGAFCSATGHAAEIFGIRFFEYGKGQTAIGGELDGENPYIHFLLYCPRLSRASKQSLASSLTEVYCKITGNQAWKPVIHICEHPYDNVVVEGRLLSDAYEECANRPFYYDLRETA